MWEKNDKTKKLNKQNKNNNKKHERTGLINCYTLFI